MQHFENIVGHIGGTAIGRLARVLLAVCELADYSGGPQLLSIPLVDDFREQVEALLTTDGALLPRGQFAIAAQGHTEGNAAYCSHCPAALAAP